MKPVTVTTDVPQQREAVYDFLDVMANHEPFTDHIMQDWRYEGRAETVDIEVIAAERPVRTVERNIGAGGKRVSTGTYTLAELPDGGTRVTFTYAWQQAPWSERLAGPLVRAIARRGLERAMQRLAEQLPAATAGRADQA
jgi:hypothetical protein